MEVNTDVEMKAASRTNMNRSQSPIISTRSKHLEEHSRGEQNLHSNPTDNILHLTWALKKSMIRQRTSSLMNRRNQTKLGWLGTVTQNADCWREEKHEPDRAVSRSYAWVRNIFSLLTSHWGNVRNDLRTLMHCFWCIVHYIWINYTYLSFLAVEAKIQTWLLR